MLSMLFKERLTEEQDEYLFNELKGFPLQYQHDICDIDTKITAYFGNEKIAQTMSDKMKAKGFNFISQVHNGRNIFHQDFVHEENQILAAQSDIDSQSPTESQSPEIFTTPTTTAERKPPIRSVFDNIKNSTSPAPASTSSPTDEQQYVTMAQLQELSKKAKDQLNAFSINLNAKVDALTATVTSSQALNSDHSLYSAPTSSAATTKTAEFKAKNELIANGICCEKCNKTIKGVEPITKLMLAVRDHVMSHFDSENPELKRFECRECPQFRTNFVDDFEKHLKKHGSMSSLPEKRQKLCFNLITDYHLKIICDLANKCFPEVFEKTPPALNTILAVDTPGRAKTSVFPKLDRLYCTRFNIPYSCNGRSVHPVIRID